MQLPSIKGFLCVQRWTKYLKAQTALEIGLLAAHLETENLGLREDMCGGARARAQPASSLSPDPEHFRSPRHLRPPPAFQSPHSSLHRSGVGFARAPAELRPPGLVMATLALSTLLLASRDRTSHRRQSAPRVLPHSPHGTPPSVPHACPLPSLLPILFLKLAYFRNGFYIAAGSGEPAPRP